MPLSQLLGRTSAIAVMLAALLVAFPSSAQTARQGEVRPDLIFHNYCSVCHGDKGDGRSRARNSLNPPPADFTSAEARNSLTRERMLLALRYGRPGTAMTAWTTQLSPKEMAAVVDYIRNTMMAPEPGSPLAKGRALYGHHCIACHGDRGQGVAASPSHPSPQGFRADRERGVMLAAVAQGHFGTLKHEFSGKLKQEEIEYTVDYVRKSLAPALAPSISGTTAHGGRSRDAKPAASANDPLAPLPGGLSGSAARGKRLYDQNCSACHGAKGDGNGPRAVRLGPKLRSLADGAYNRPALYSAIASGRTGTDMPAFSAALDAQQLADVSEFVWRTHVAPARMARGAK